MMVKIINYDWWTRSNEGDLLFIQKEVNNNVITNTMKLTGDE